MKDFNTYRRERYARLKMTLHAQELREGVNSRRREAYARETRNPEYRDKINARRRELYRPSASA